MVQPRQVVKDPIFGSVPLIPTTVIGANGEAVTSWRIDLDWQPPLPRGAVRGDPRRQTYCCDLPRFFYVDQPRTCVQCCDAFVFEAKEQKYWYETLGFRLDSIAVRCASCRKKRRSDRAIGRTLERAVVEAAAHPEEASVLLSLAEATVAHAERFGTGDLDRALSACRKARRAAPGFAPALYWEGRVQEAAGRTAKALAAYRAFLGESEGKGRLEALRRDTQRRESACPPASE